MDNIIKIKMQQSITKSHSNERLFNMYYDLEEEWKKHMIAAKNIKLQMKQIQDDLIKK
jgi:hypothetical protein